MISVKEVKRGVAIKGPFAGCNYIEYGFSKEDQEIFYKQYKAARDKELARIEPMRTVDSGKYSMLVDAVTQKIKVEAFVPKIHAGVIDGLKAKLYEQKIDVLGTYQKSNGNWQIYVDNAPVEKLVDEANSFECEICGKSLETLGKLNQHRPTCKRHHAKRQEEAGIAS